MPPEPDDESAESVDSLLAAVARIPVEQHWAPPTELEEYKLLRPIGRGGMGSVWLAEDQLLDRLVAIKFIAHAAPDPHLRERFAIEARAAARLQHVNVVTVHRFGEVAGRPFLVSEYVRGESLDKIAKPVEWKRALELGIALARGLAAAHRHGIVHRDIKPSNAILAADGDVKLVDFGLAKLGSQAESLPLAQGSPDLATAKTELTKTGVIAGTPLYLAPEVRAGGPADRRSDVYQVGCILYELVTSRAPFVDAPDSQGADVKLDIPDAAAFVAVVERCLRRDPQARFASGDELREALEQLAEPVLGGALPDGNPYRGLLAFESEHRALFFGRGAEIRTVVERLRADPFVIVTADSGAGKSSVCRAGVVPHILDGALGDNRAWVAAQLVPGTAPLSSLVAALAHAVNIDEQRLEALTDAPAELVRELRKVLGRERGLLVFVDQLEELVTLGDRQDADVAARTLAQLASGIPGIKLLATVRSDFLTRIGELPELGELLSRALYLLPPLSAEGAREAIVGPARTKGVTFEAEGLVDTLADSARALELPLLAFTLAQLWDARDKDVISARSLEQIGGVRGALARHADGVLAGLLPQQREVARRLLLRLVSIEKTRARRTSDELAVFDRAVLDALVRGRLVVARGDDPPAFELAHERLIDGWPTLAAWLAESGEAVAAHARLAAAARDWERLERARERLWGERQLVDLARLANEELTASETAFVVASRRAVRRRRVLRIVGALAVPLIIGVGYATARLIAQRDLDARVEARLDTARPPHLIARQFDDVAKREADLSYAAYDRGDNDAGNIAWLNALATSTRARDNYNRASRELEAALLLDTSRDDVRAQLVKITVERIALADREYQVAERAELLARLALYDRGHAAAQFTGPAHLHVTTKPNATLSLVRDGQEVPLDGELDPGSYTLLAHADRHAPIVVPLLLRASETRSLTLDLPTANVVPPDFVYVSAGTFLYGAGDERIRTWVGTAPLHQMRTKSFLIARTETTYAQWIEFLESLPEPDRTQRAPHIENSETIQEGGLMELSHRTGAWELWFSPSTAKYHARAGQPIVYTDRTTRAQQDWLKMPVSGITPDDAEAYVAWLAKTGKVPRARLCTEAEWERAARGADGRDYPQGDHLERDDANVDVTYGQKQGGFGMDEVGSHPASRSPFGLVDMAGNVWEITRPLNGHEYVMRGGCFYTDAKSASIPNRNPAAPTFKHLQLGLRVCADAP